MGIARSTGALIGTSESAGDTITNNSTDTGSEVDVLGDNTSDGDAWMYLVYTSGLAAGTIDIKFNQRRVTVSAYSKVNFERSIVPEVATLRKIPLGKMPVSRYMNVEVKNNATGGSLTNVSILYELVKFS